MNALLVYLLILKASVITFNGQSTLPVLREDLVVKRQLLTDRELNTAVATGRSAPGPMGIYVVSVGYQAAGPAGAFAAWLAVMTPAFLAIPVLRYAGHRASHPRVRSMLGASLLASVGLIVASAIDLAPGAITGPLTVALMLGSFVLVAFARVETVWVIVGSALIALLAAVV